MFGSIQSHERAVATAADAVPSIFDAILMDRETLVRQIVNDYFKAVLSEPPVFAKE